MKIETGIRPHTLKIMDCHRDVRGMNLGARTGLDWDKLNDGTKRKILLNLTEEEAEWFTEQGAKVVCLPPNPDRNRMEPVYFTDLRLQYNGKKPPQPGQEWNTYYNGPHVIMVVPGGHDRELTEDTVSNLDTAYITKLDIMVNIGPAKLINGERVMRGPNGDIPGINLYIDTLIATTAPTATSELGYIPAEAMVVDRESQEEYESMMRRKAEVDAGVPF